MADNHRDPLDSIESVGMAAVGVGAAAAILSRRGGSRLLSDGFKRASKALSGATNELSSVALRDMDANALSSAWRTAKSIYNTPSLPSLRIDSPKSLLNVLHLENSLKENNQQILYKMYDDQLLIPIKREFEQNFGQGNEVIERKASDFAEQTVRRAREAFSNQEGTAAPTFDQRFLDKHFSGGDFDSEQQRQMTERILEVVRERKEGREAFVEANRPLIDAINEEFNNIDLLGKKFGMREQEGSGRKVFDSIRDSRAVTVNDILERPEAFGTLAARSQSGGQVQIKDMIEMMQQKVSQNEAYGQLFVDKDMLRINEAGEVFSFDEVTRLKDRALDEFANTLPGKLMKKRDILNAKSAPNLKYFGVGKADPILARLAEENPEGHPASRIAQSYVRILDRTFRVNGISLEHVPELDNTYLASGEHGTTNRLIKSMMGDLERKPASQNKWLRSLDIFSGTEPSKFRTMLSQITKFNDPRWGRNIVSDLLTPGDFNPDDPQFITGYFNRIKDLDSFMAKTTKALDRKSVNLLHGAATGRAKEYLNLLRLDDNEMIEQLMNRNSARMLNPELASLVSRHMKDPKNAMDAMTIISDNSLYGGARAVRYPEMLRKEIAKEAFISHIEQNGKAKSSLLGLFEDSKLSGQSLDEAKYLANWGVLQRTSGVHPSSNSTRSLRDLNIAREQTDLLFRGQMLDNTSNFESSFWESFQQNMSSMVRQKAPLAQKGFQREDDLIPGHNYGQWMFMQKAISPLEVIKNLNDTSKLKAFGKQFYAGRNNMEDVTTATLFPYFSLYRLVDPLSIIGLGFSARSTGSVGDLAASIMLKRVAPIAGGLTALSYLNYRSEAYTGTSLTGAAANAAANIDLTWRGFADKTGLTGVLKDQYMLNPMSQYWNEQEPQSQEERKEWYENGYSPVRKGRWWSFGSASEFRGGKIDYYQPNFVRRANSNYYDVSMFGSESEKWAHSWIPTPAHPLAPIRRLLNPYWLENMHYEDRPYPVTGKMFGEGTPWGAILNPTVGEILKPQRKMHQRELGGTLVDVRDLIAQRNEETKRKAGDNTSLVRVENGGFSPVSYTPLGSPIDGEAIASLTIRNGEISGEVLGSDYTSMSFAEYDPVHDAIQGRAMSLGAGIGNGAGAAGFSDNLGSGDLSFFDRIRVEADRGGVMATLIDKALPVSIISNLNHQTFARSQLQPKGGHEGVIVNDPIFKSRERSLPEDEDLLADLRNTTSTKQFLQDAGYSGKELMGMYGFMFEELVTPSQKVRWQSADRMDSFSRRFWDGSWGGAGGEFMEIARRFFPHEDHSIEQINPIQNTMPDWMPERFQTGDPYEKLPKGEMRLPGAGYEEMYDLHPDMYGKYGAFDRMKILGDIAPWSKEYRVWRDIAQKTVEDPELKEEMKRIRNQVKAQSRNHEFYPYRFAGVKLEEREVTIEEITPQGFKVVGEDQGMRMAGIKIPGKELAMHLQPGMNVRVKYDPNPSTGKLTPVIVMTEDGNLNRQLLKSGEAEASEGKTAADFQARFTPAQIDRGKAYEILAHAPIPYLHNKFMRVNTAIESYKEEQIYGTPYATWSHPIEGFIIPSFQKAYAISGTHAAVSVASWAASEYMKNKSVSTAAGRGAKVAANVAFGLTNPGAFAGGMIGFMTNINTRYVRTGSRIGAAVGLIGYGAVNAQNPFFAAGAGAVLGYGIAEQFWKGASKGNKGAAIGALAGTAISALMNPSFDKAKMFGEYIPEKVKHKWEIEEYYDRLKYIKYMGLYEKAARKAKSKEDIDIDKIVNKYERDAKKREEVKQRLLANRDRISNTYVEGDQRKADLLADLDTRISALTYPQQILKAGKYTKAALAYKQAAESTVYGLTENASWSQMLRAVPKSERDYILEFANERDPEKRKEIMKYMSPYRKRILQLAWGGKVDELESNESYFRKHELPGMTWSGWKPDVDLDHVQMKTIQNEGMLLSDFGFYESEAETLQAQAAPEVEMNEGSGGLELKKNLLTALNGAGLIGVDVSLEPSSTPGLQMIANIVRIGDYQLKEKLNGAVGRLFY